MNNIVKAIGITVALLLTCYAEVKILNNGGGILGITFLTVSFVLILLASGVLISQVVEEEEEREKEIKELKEKLEERKYYTPDILKDVRRGQKRRQRRS